MRQSLRLLSHMGYPESTRFRDFSGRGTERQGDGRVVIWGSSHFPASTQRLTRELQLFEGGVRSLPPGFRADFRDVAARPTRAKQ